MDYASTILSKLPGASRRDHGVGRLVDTLKTYLPDDHVDQVLRAYTFGAGAHDGQTRKSGEPYITHPIAVAQELADMHLDAQAITAAILHDVVEDTSASLDDIEEHFGHEVAQLVDAVSKLDQIQFRSRAEAQAESFRKMMLAMIEDIRVILVKLSDRLHNMQTLGAMPADKKKRIARETLDIYAPIANRLGINRLKIKLEDLGFMHLYPFRYRVLEKALKKSKGSQRQIVKRISEEFSKALEEEGIKGDVVGREKHLYSIYKKMTEKKRLLSDIVDVYGFRIIVDDVNTCYQTLGLVHGLYKPMPGRFKDYIAIPRINGYQSLHTTLFGPKGLPLEVQIRTREMDRVAEAGVASHWIYKADEKADATPQRRAREWLSNLAEIQQSGTSEEFLESVKVDLFPDKIYVFTPKGDIMPLPKGATTVDFAYAVHTDIGDRCVAAKIDRALVPLRTQLQNGQTVEVITARGAKPNPHWLTFVRSAKARTAIRNHMKNLRAVESVDLGKRLLDKSLKDLGSSLRKVGKVRMASVLEELELKDASELFEQLGLGERLAPLTARILVGVGEESETDDRGVAGLIIAGTEGMVISYARCCHPIPGDVVMGYLTAGRGIVIHRNTCGNLSNFRKQPEKWISVTWEKEIDRDFSCQIQTETRNRTGVLAEVAATIADCGSNIEQVEVLGRHEDCSILTFLLSVKDRNHLAKIMRNVRNMPNVMRVSRDCA
ncbi:MAG: bifunctional (p)ppGpp synthetase/guanosine-3',5'-bis(diphosphate) 3'-pyrophosphohydrolase [Gammaproteobacteria bacterium]|nr:bifunctional (p)ppGpp synthetase/guanosine-3',5'-bis(diphosphate) 3'-pyrophosphohydrolase [Gammaproteobacteria bacterium]MBU2676171.1 bifunctional (p)ppGpp synthetase/guanosine-3',5'-bis(diphosphate) 3'-pyrophosphohydrolase [Gammaproteobacteria bacterium]NNC58072.1 bifunctional (p)ppGpp synthetase/guanosine-3',5'-bis(diphosphate) 3'-pyrophosphohydrolase [Woeseiaceae bacterium]NNL49907.1 bifunctional (p)ppGpp synthetase/guanosine-3',5'-bis(diphosphate) 3'-pyrophosphohydrolase [Woeseiaceae bact